MPLLRDERRGLAAEGADDAEPGGGIVEHLVGHAHPAVVAHGYYADVAARVEFRKRRRGEKPVESHSRTVRRELAEAGDVKLILMSDIFFKEESPVLCNHAR